MNCEMCGTESNLINSLVEGVELKVCKNCSAFGKSIKRPIRRLPPSSSPSSRPIFQKKPDKEIVQVIIDDFSKIIKDKREKMGLKQKELAKYLAERESLIHKMESGSITPSIDLARKLERQLSIKLIEEQEVKSQNLKINSAKLTIGDMIKQKLQ
jgi:uncharacterized protein (TIGR00270 family)